MKLSTFNKKYKIQLERSGWNNQIDVSTDDQLQFCCGVKEVEINNLVHIGNNELKAWTFNKLKDYLKVIACNDVDGKRSGVLLTDNNKDGVIHQWLSEIIEPVYMGKNEPHDTKIYLWAIPLRKLK